MNEELTAVKGMNDILPPESARWEWLEEKVRRLMVRFAYRNIRTPIVEPTGLFIRSLGEVTDIVEKEMYCFEDKLNGQALTLRPESTASVVRAVSQHSMLYEGGQRLYYMGPMFRHERPQRGRYRQFHQVGAEALGFPGPEMDAEIILLAHTLWQELGLKEVRLELNSLGQPAERSAHRTALIAYFEQHAELLDADAQRRLHSNPLRILDSKNPAMQSMLEGAPQLIDFLSPASLQHLDAVKQILQANGVPYRINPRLVRGLDYYNLTVFEFITDSLGAQGTIAAGGRYDYLIEQISGKASPAVGFAFGVERVLDLMQTQGLLADTPALDAYAIVGDAKAWPVVMQTLQALRAQGVSVQMHTGNENQGVASMKSQFKKADASGARYALIFGESEIAQGQVGVKPLRGEVVAGTQFVQALADVASWAQVLKA